MSDEWVEVMLTFDPLEAEMIKDLLESGDIPVVLRSCKVSPYPVNVGRMGEIRVLVRSIDKDAAERVIQGTTDTGPESPEP